MKRYIIVASFLALCGNLFADSVLNKVVFDEIKKIECRRRQLDIESQGWMYMLLYEFCRHHGDGNCEKKIAELKNRLDSDALMWCKECQQACEEFDPELLQKAIHNEYGT